MADNLLAGFGDFITGQSGARWLEMMSGATPAQIQQNEMNRAKLQAFQQEQAKAEKRNQILSRMGQGDDVMRELLAVDPEMAIRFQEMQRKRDRDTQRMQMMQQVLGGSMGAGTAKQMAAYGAMTGDPNLIAAANFFGESDADTREALRQQKKEELLASNIGAAPTAPDNRGGFELPKLEGELNTLLQRRSALAQSAFSGDKDVSRAIGDIDRRVEVLNEQVAEKRNKVYEAEDALSKAQIAAQTVDSLLAHSGFNDAVGSKLLEREYLFGWKDEPMEGSDAAGFMTLFNQSKGQTFLEAYQMLKGGGPITDIEGKKAEQALNAMDISTSEEDFKKAAKNYRDAVLQGAEKLAKRAGLSKKTTERTPEEAAVKAGAKPGDVQKIEKQIFNSDEPSQQGGKSSAVQELLRRGYTEDDLRARGLIN